VTKYITTIATTKIRALALLSAGYASEVKNLSSYKLQIAWDKDASGMPVSRIGNSGYSVGSLQTDLGSKTDRRGSNPTVYALVNAYEQWAALDPANRLIRGQDIGASLRANGRTLEASPSALLDAENQRCFNSFLDSDTGRQYVWTMDNIQIEKMVSAH